MKTHARFAWPALVTFGLLAACAHGQRPDVEAATSVTTTTVYRDDRAGVTNLQPPDFDPRIIEQIASARCDRERACGNVGARGHYSDGDACLRHMRESVSDDLNGRRCPLGVDAGALDACMRSIEGEGCGDGVAVLNRARRCLSDVVCAR